MKIALVRGPFLRANGIRPWEYLDRHSSAFDITAFTSDPAQHDTESLDMAVESLPWYDGKPSLFGYDQFFFKAFRKFDLPRAILGGMQSLAAEYDIVHTSENFNIFSAQAARACAGQDARFVFTAGENIPFYPNSVPTGLHKSYVNRRADGATATTIQGKRALIHEGMAHEDIDVVPNAIDLSEFTPAKVTASQVGLPDRLDDTFVFLFVHRLCEQKGTPYLVEAFEQFQEQTDDGALILVGEDVLEDEAVTRQIDQHPDIYHLDHVPHGQISDLYNFADLFVLPSVTVRHNQEQFGMALIEAMACATPSVVTNVGGLPHVAQHGETSLVVEERSPAVLASAFETLYTDSEMYGRFVENGRQHVSEQFSPQVVAERLKDFYTGLAAMRV